MSNDKEDETSISARRERLYAEAEKHRGFNIKKITKGENLEEQVTRQNAVLYLYGQLFNKN